MGARRLRGMGRSAALALVLAAFAAGGAGAQGFLQDVAGLLGGDKETLSRLVLRQLGMESGFKLSPAQMQVVNGVVGAGVFESLVGDDPAALGPETLADLARLALQANAALEAGIAPDAVEEIAQAALGGPLEDEVFLAAARVQAAWDSVGVEAGVTRSWLGYTLGEGWSAELLQAAGLGVADAVRLGADAEQMALAVSVAVAQEPGAEAAGLVRREREFLLGRVQSDERARRLAVFEAYRAAVGAGVARSVAYGLYEHVLLEEWDAGRARGVFAGLGAAVAQGVPAQPLALALVVRLEQEPGVDIEEAVRQEEAFVRQSLGLPPALPADGGTGQGGGGASAADTVAAETSPASPAPTPEEEPVAQADAAPPAVAEPAPEAVPAKPVKPKKPAKPKKPKKKKDRPQTAAAKRVEWDRLERSIRSFLGTPYVWGGETRQGTDCSGFTQTIYQEQGVPIPRVSRDQHGFLKRGAALVGGPRAQQKLGRGALVFFNKNGRGRITHVGVYMGGGKFAHASSSRGVVISDFTKRYYQKLFVDGGHVCPVN